MVRKLTRIDERLARSTAARRAATARLRPPRGVEQHQPGGPRRAGRRQLVGGAQQRLEGGVAGQSPNDKPRRNSSQDLRAAGRGDGGATTVDFDEEVELARAAERLARTEGGSTKDLKPLQPGSKGASPQDWQSDPMAA